MVLRFRHVVIVAALQRSEGIAEVKLEGSYLCNLTTDLFCGDLRDLQIRVRVIPLRGNVVEGQAERFALPGRERRQVEVHRFVVRTAGTQHVDGKFFALRRLSQYRP